MRLTLITENNQILQQTAEKLNISIDELNKLLTDADPTGRKYKLFILKLLNKESIILPEDNYRVKETLNNFQKYQRNLAIKDILKYSSLHELETALEPFIGSVSKKQGGNNINPLSLHGVRLILDKGEFKTYRVTNVESLKDIGEGTKWCTRRSYPDCMAQYYLSRYYWIGVVYKNGKPFIQYTPDYIQIMDVDDVKIDYNVSDIIPKPNLDSDFLINYARFVIRGRWPKIESKLMKCPGHAYLYARFIIEDRWPKAEPYIMKDPEYAYKYAVDVVKGIWPEAEPYMAQSPQYAHDYARNIKGRWPEAEPAIMKDPRYAYNYARNIIKGTWPEAEPTIMKDPCCAYLYAKHVITDVWPEAEPYIMKDLEWAVAYAKDIKGRWPEIEPAVFNSEYKDYYTYAVIGR